MWTVSYYITVHKNIPSLYHPADMTDAPMFSLKGQRTDVNLHLKVHWSFPLPGKKQVGVIQASH